MEKVIHPILEKYHLPLYHTNPEYHASFAWCLLEATDPAHAESAVRADIEDDEQNPSDEGMIARGTPIPQDLVEALGKIYGNQVLAKQPDGGWEISELVLRAGKAFHSISLS